MDREAWGTQSRASQELDTTEGLNCSLPLLPDSKLFYSQGVCTTK